MPSPLRTALFAAACFVLVVTARYVGVDGPHGLTEPLMSPSAGIGLVWLASSRGRRELTVDVVVYAVTVVLGLWASDLLGFQDNSGWQYALAVLAPVQPLVAVHALRRLGPHLWGGGGREGMRTPADFALVLAAIALGTLVFSVVRAIAGEVFIPAETLSLALGRATRTASAMVAIGVVGLLVGARVAEVRDAGEPFLGRVRPATVGHVLGASLMTAVIFVVGFGLNPQAPTTFVVTLAIVWVATRCNPVVTASFCLVVGAVGVGLTIADIGPIAAIPDVVSRAAVAQVFVVVLMVLGMVISLSRNQVLESVATLARSEAANARRAAELDLVMANLVDGVAIIEQGGRIVHANTALRTAFGTQEDTEVDQVRPDSEVPDEERLVRGSDGRLLTDEISPLTRALGGEEVQAEEWRAPATAGPITWVTISGVPLPAEEGGPPRAMLVLRDVTAEKAHQDALVARAAELDLVIDNLNDGLAIVEEDGTFSQANDALRTIFYGSSEERQGPGAIEEPAEYHLFQPDGRPLAEEDYPYKRALRGVDVREEEQHLRRPGAATQVLSVSAFPLPSEAGRQRRAVVVVRDITLERSYQDGLASFAGTVAHDLNNPLSVIDGWAEAIQEDLAESDDALAQEAVPMVRHIRAGVEQMRGFISDLLAHAVARDQTLRCEWVTLSTMVKHVATQRDRPDLPHGGIEVGDLPDVWADRLLVRQVVENLIGNAVKYVAPGVTPEIHVSASTTPDGWVEVRVSDNGIGIDPAQRERVFDSFHRASAGAYVGTGLGLAICKRIVERHGGTIRVEGRPGGGSSFVFTLPASAEVFARVTT